MNTTNEELLDQPFTLGEIPADILFMWGTLTLLMFGYWFVRYRQAGVLTFDVFFCALYLYVPIVFMALLAYSPYNTFSTTEWHWHYVPFLREAFYVSLFGAAVFGVSAIVAARWDSAPPGYRLVYRAIHDFWGTVPGLTLLVTVVVVLGSLTVATAGFTNAREHVMTHTELRPAHLLFSWFAVMGMYFALIEGYCQRSWKLTGLGVLLTLLMLGFGTRKVTVGTLLYYGAVRLINTRTRRVATTVLCSVLTILGLIVIGLTVEGLRQKQGKMSSERFASAPLHLLFGNNLSELRDFAWMLSAWDHEPIMGATYLSGSLAWIPSYLMPIRKELGWGVFSTEMTGLGGAGHPGLRPTIFGEAYFNFGLLGVVVFAMLLGAVFGRTAAFAQRTLELADPRERAFRLDVARFCTLSSSCVSSNPPPGFNPTSNWDCSW